MPIVAFRNTERNVLSHHFFLKMPVAFIHGCTDFTDLLRTYNLTSQSHTLLKSSLRGLLMLIYNKSYIEQVTLI